MCQSKLVEFQIMCLGTAEEVKQVFISGVNNVIYECPSKCLVDALFNLISCYYFFELIILVLLKVFYFSCKILVCFVYKVTVFGIVNIMLSSRNSNIFMINQFHLKLYAFLVGFGIVTVFHL